MKKVGILWDIDGVLVESEPLHREKLVAIASDPFETGNADGDNGVTIQESDWNILHGKGDHGVYDWVIEQNPDYPLSQDKFLAACAAYYLKNAPSLKPRDGAPEVVEYANKLGIKQAAVSSGVRPQVDANLLVKDYLSYMEFSISADDISPDRRKPNPYPYLLGIERLSADMDDDVANSQFISIEDSASGNKSGKLADTMAIYWKIEDGQADSPYADLTIAYNDDFVTIMKRVLNGSQ